MQFVLAPSVTGKVSSVFWTADAGVEIIDEFSMFTTARINSGTGLCGNGNYSVSLVLIGEGTDNTGYCEAFLTTDTDTPPEITGTLPVPAKEVECDDIPSVEVLSATDECDYTVDVIGNSVAGNATSTATSLYTLTRTWVATDSCGLTDTHQQVLDILDTTPPELGNVDEAGVHTYDCTTPATPCDATASDNCDDDVTITVTETVSGDSCDSTTTYTYTATDHAGNTDTASQMFRVQDTTAPTLIGVSTQDVTVECDAVPDYSSLVTAVDDCHNVTTTISVDPTPGSCVDTYDVTYNFTATDECANTVSTQQVVHVEDTTPPRIIGVTENLDADCSSIPAPCNVTVVDNCAADQDLAVTSSSSSYVDGDCHNYQIMYTWFAEDNCGNSDVAYQTVAVTDTTPPTFSGYPPNVTVECDAVPSWNLTATDDCGPDPVVEKTETDTVEGNVTIREVIYSAQDLCGQVETHYQYITIVDTTPPVLLGVPDATAEFDCVADAAPTLIGDDNCDCPVDICLDITKEQSCEYNYTETRTWTATDCVGLTDSFVQIVTVTDDKSPTFEGLPDDCDRECNETCPVYDVTASDECEGVVDVNTTSSTDDGTCEHEEIITTVFTVVDDCGLTNSSTYTETVVDTHAPYITNDFAIDLDMDCDTFNSDPNHALDTHDFGITDNCDLNPVTTQGWRDGNGPSLFKTRGWESCTELFYLDVTAVDDCGNAMDNYTHTFNITDSQPPVWSSFVANETKEWTEDVECIEDLNLTASDVCTTEHISRDDGEKTPGSCDRQYTCTQIHSVVDDCGNYADDQVHTIEVVDTTPPVFNTSVADESGECEIDIMRAIAACDTAPGMDVDTCFADHEVDVLITSTYVYYDCTHNYSIAVNYTASDDCGNVAEDSATFSAYDSEAPVVTAPADYVSGDVCVIDAMSADEANYTDNCDESVTESVTSVSDKYGTNFTFCGTDACGNVGCDETIVTFPPYVPTLDVPVGGQLECADNLTFPEVVPPTHCNETADLTYVEYRLNGSCPEHVIYTRVYSLMYDGESFTSSNWTHTMTYKDTEKPTYDSDHEFFVGLTGTWNATSQELTYDLLCNHSDLQFVAPEWEDCADFSTADTQTSSTWDEPSNTGSYGSVYSATDSCGNTDELNYLVVVTDPFDIEWDSDFPSFNGSLECDETLYAEDFPNGTHPCGDVDTVFTITDGCPTSNYTANWTLTATKTGDSTHEPLVESGSIEHVGYAPTWDNADEWEDTESECDADDGECDELYESIPTTPSISATDSCGELVPVSCVRTTDTDEVCYKEVEFTCEAEDGCGNKITHTFSYIYEDKYPLPESPSNHTAAECPTDLSEWTAHVDGCSNDTGIYIKNVCIQDVCERDTCWDEYLDVDDTVSPSISVDSHTKREYCTVPDATVDAECDDECSVCHLTESTETDYFYGDAQYLHNRTVTWYFDATDDCQNNASAIAVIEYYDNVPPNFVSLPAADINQEYLASYFEDGSWDSYLDTYVDSVDCFDDCGPCNVSVSNETEYGNCTANFSISFNWYTDTIDTLFSVDTTTITFEDSVPPVLTPSTNAAFMWLDGSTLYCDNPMLDDWSSKITTFTASDGASGNLTDEIDFTETIEGNVDDCSYNVTWMWTVEDECGHTAEEMLQIFVIPHSDSCAVYEPQLECNDTSHCFDDQASWDACMLDYFTFVYNGYHGEFNETSAALPDNEFTISAALPTSIDRECNGETNYSTTFFVHDSAGYEVCNRTWTAVLLDQAPPSITLPSLSEDYECDPEIPVGTVDDNCDWSIHWDNVTISTTVGSNGYDHALLNNGDDLYSDVFYVTYTLEDDCGNLATEQVVVSFDDTEKPYWVNEPWMEDPETANCTVAVPVDPEFADNCTNATGVWTETDSHVDCDHEGWVEYEFTVTDNAGHFISEKMKHYYEDYTPPVFDEPLPVADLEFDVNDHGECRPPSMPVLTVNDTCDENAYVTVTGADADFWDHNEGLSQNWIREWTGYDDCGNPATHTQNFTLVDTKAPNATTPMDNTSGECYAVADPVDFGWEDVCAYTTDPTETTEYLCVTNPSHADFGKWYVETHTDCATDTADNTACESYSHTVVDTTPPTLSVNPQASPDWVFYKNPNVSMCAGKLPALVKFDVCASNLTLIDDGFKLEGDACFANYSYDWVVEDPCGNVAKESYNYSYVDTQPPIVEDLESEDFNVTCTDQDFIEGKVYDMNMSLTSADVDDCAELDVRFSYEGDGDYCNGDEVYTWEVCDICGNCVDEKIVLRFTFVEDVTPPPVEAAVLQMTAPFYDSCMDDPTDVTAQVPASVIDTCAGSVPTSVEQYFNASFYDDGFESTLPSDVDTAKCVVEYSAYNVTATDDCGNLGWATVDQFVYDNTPPQYDTTPDTDGYQSYCTEKYDPYFLDFSDECLEVTETIDDLKSNVQCDYNYTTTYTSTITDDCDNTNTAVWEVRSYDNVPPVDSDPNADTEVFQDSCSLNLTGLQTFGNATDECGDEVFDYDLQAGWVNTEEMVFKTIDGVDYCNVARYNLTYMAQDDCLNKAFKERLVYVYKSDSPVITFTGTSNAECDLPAAPVVAVTSVCGVNSGVDFTATETPGTCVGNSKMTYEYTASSIYCVESTKNFTATSEDTTPPNLDYYPDDTISECNETLYTLIATDDCDTGNITVDISYVVSDDDGDFTGWSNTTYTATYADDCGNSDNHTWTDSVADTVGPSFPVNATQVLTLDCSDEVPELEVLEHVEDCYLLDSGASRTCVEGNCSHEQTCTDTWFACDNNTCAYEYHTFEIKDFEAPELTQLNDAVVSGTVYECDEDVAIPEWNVTDNCDVNLVAADIVVSFTNGSTGDFANDVDETFVYSLMWFASVYDECGNSAEANVSYVVNDTTPPVLENVPADASVECHEVPLYYEGMVTAYDNCAPDVTPVYDETTAPGGCDCNYTLTRSWTSTDHNGNVNTSVVVIDVADTTPPVLHNIPSFQIAESDNIPSAPEISTDDGVFATDLDSQGGLYYLNESTITFTETYSCGTSLDCVNAGVTEFNITWTWTVVDACGHATAESVVVMVIDTTPPTFNEGPDNATAECDNYVKCEPFVIDEHLSYFSGLPEDIPVDVTEVDVTPANPPTDVIKIVKITYTATDNAANEQVHTYFVTYYDYHAPVFSQYPADETVECDCDTFPVMPTVVAVDNCDGEVVVDATEAKADGSCDDEYTLNRTWTTTDASGHTETHSQIVSVTDTESPTFLYTPEELTMLCNHVPADTSDHSFWDIDVRDSCDPDPQLTYTLNEVLDTTHNCGGEKTMEFTWTATDRCGNTATFDQTINVVDPVLPTVLSGASQTCVNWDDSEGDQYMLIGSSTFETEDNCGDEPTVTYLSCNGTDTATSGCGNIGVNGDASMGVYINSGPDAVYDFYYKVEDDCGNERTFRKRFLIPRYESSSCLTPIVIPSAPSAP